MLILIKSNIMSVCLFVEGFCLPLKLLICQGKACNDFGEGYHHYLKKNHTKKKLFSLHLNKTEMECQPNPFLKGPRGL